MQHTNLPRWVAWLQDNMLLNFLIIAEGYILGYTLIQGWVPDLQNPSSWGIARGIGVIVFFAAGGAAGGLVVRLSFTSAHHFAQKHYSAAIFNFTGLLLLVAAEIWCSLTERSNNLAPSPADHAVLSYLGIPTATISPTLFIIAVIIPFVALFWGFAQDKAPNEDTASIQQQLEQELMRAEYAAKKRQIQAQNLRSLYTTMTQAPPEPDPISDELEEEQSETNEGHDELIEDVSHGKITPIRAIGVPKGLLTASQFRTWIQTELGVTLSQDDATAFVKSLRGATQLPNVAGRPWAARAATIKAAARKKWQSPILEQDA